MRHAHALLASLMLLPLAGGAARAADRAESFKSFTQRIGVKVKYYHAVTEPTLIRARLVHPTMGVDLKRNGETGYLYSAATEQGVATKKEARSLLKAQVARFDRVAFIPYDRDFTSQRVEHPIPAFKPSKQ